MRPVFEEIDEKFRALVESHGLGGAVVDVKVGTLSPQQALGNPSRRDYPILEGREVMIEARVLDGRGQAFTDRPGVFTGTLNDVLALNRDNNNERAIYIATLNAVMAHLGLVEGTGHCRDEEPEECSREIARQMLSDYGRVRVGLIGLQPAILENLVETFGAENVRCTDLNPKNTGSVKYGAEIWDGRTATAALVGWADVVLATSSSLTNGTFDEIREEAAAAGKPLVVFGVTGAGVSRLLGLKRLCFKAH
jgi:uncharacterized protein (DUF4213/DUF364 family)